MELLQHLDALNYHEAWIGEHHSGGFEIIANPELFIAAAAERTRYIRLGTGVVSLPYHNPFMLADRMVQLDYQTRGRAMLGVGPGSLVYDAKKIGIDPADQRRMMNESLDVIIELLRGESVTRKFRLVRSAGCKVAVAAVQPAADGDGGGGGTVSRWCTGGGAAWAGDAVDRRHERRCHETSCQQLGALY